MATFTIDDYTLEKKRIGKGSFSTVYKGIHNCTGKVYAIKEISFDINKSKNNIKREINVMKKLNHDNIVKLHNVIIDTKYNNLYLVLDYYPLGDLAKFLNKRCLKEIYCQKYVLQLSNGLKYLLENKIIHRDLKPQNILVTETYNIKITDFGFARYFDSDIMIQTMCGSPIYMAPEIMMHKKYNNKSDLWSVGIIMFEMLTGHPPFRSRNIIDLINSIKKKKIELPKNITLSKNGQDLLFGFLKVNPDERISWNMFFNHIWLEKDHIMENENKFLEIDIDKSLPNISDMKLSNQFYNFEYNSINKPDLSFDDNFFNSSDSEYLSASEYNDFDNEQSESNISFGDESNTKAISNPIPIKNYQTSHKHNSEHMFNSIRQDYVIVPRNSPDYKSEPHVSSSPRLKDVLNTSITILKASYEYISNKSI